MTVLSSSQLSARDRVVKGDSVFITGPGGTGKSYLTRMLIDELRATKYVSVTASTGVAAFHIGGSTIHSFLGTALNNNTESLKRALKRGRVNTGAAARDRMRYSDVIFVDEVSMLTGDYIDMMDWWLRVSTRRDEPFGGKQMVFVGDFFQLPPVVTADMKVKHHYAFQADAWSGAGVDRLDLEENHRQGVCDFTHHLNGLRVGSLDGEAQAYFMDRVGVQLREEPLELHPTNDLVESINRRRLKQIDNPEVISKAEYRGQSRYWPMLEKNMPSPDRLILKVGALVMVTRNNPDCGLYNGQRGTVVSVDRTSGFPRVVVQLMGSDSRRVGIEPIEWHHFSHDGTPVSTVTQLPLRLAWSVSIHKSQGMTLEHVKVNTRSVFAAGQAYVALSRCKNIHGLSLTSPITPQDVWADRSCAEYYGLV